MAGHQQKDPYVHGQMDMAQHEGTYRGFLEACKWISLTSLVTILFFTLWFAVDGVGFFGALIATLAFVAFGLWFVRFFFPTPKKG